MTSSSGRIEEDGEDEEERVRGGVGADFRTGCPLPRVALRDGGMVGLSAVGAIGLEVIVMSGLVAIEKVLYVVQMVVEDKERNLGW